jgi:TetR/AcrR family transcriptional regulator
MRKIAERVDMGLSAVQRHFPTWEALFQAMMTRVTADYVRVFDTLLNETKASRRRQFQNVLDHLLREVRRPVTQSLFAQVWALAQSNDYVRTMMQDMYAYERGVFEFFIGELKPGLERKDVARRAALMLSQIEGLMLLIPQQTRFPASLAGIEQLRIENILTSPSRPRPPEPRAEAGPVRQVRRCAARSRRLRAAPAGRRRGWPAAGSAGR